MLQEHKINTNLGSEGSLEQVLKASALLFQSFGPKDSSRLTLQGDYVFWYSLSFRYQQIIKIIFLVMTI